MGTHELEELITEADDAFWQIIAGRFPEARSGDLSPPTTVRLRRAATEAVSEWIENNVPPPRRCKTYGREILGMRGDPAFRTGDCDACAYRLCNLVPRLVAALREASEYVEQVRDCSGEDQGETRMLRRWRKLLRQPKAQDA